MTDWTTALPDWESRIVARQSMVPVKPIFPEEAEDALSVFSALRMMDADGSPTMGEACEPWVIELVEALFGSYDRKRKRRLITNYFLMVSKKNGKSMIAAAVMLTALILNTRQAGEFIILAPTKEAADNAYKPIREMILADDELNDRFQEQQHIKTVTCRLTRASLKVVAADSATVTGKKAIGVFIDELHEFGKNSKAAAMLTEATGGITSRPEGFIFYCTTQSAEPPAGVFLDTLGYARKVRDGKVKDPRFLPIIYEFPDHMLKSKAYEDLDNAYITNPNWGISVDAEVIEQKLLEAKEAGEHKVRDVRAKHLNIEIGLNLRSDRWAGADFWEAAVDKTITLESLIERSEVAVIGIDGGGLDDLLGLTVLGRERETGRWLLWCHAWAHEIALERRKEIAPRLLDFQNQGDLTIVQRPGDDVTAVCDLICKVRDSGLLPDEKSIGVDAAGIGAIVDELITEERGIEMKHIVAISQGYKLNGAIKDTERKVAGGELLHAGRPMMSWCVGNARIEDKGNAILITKQASGKAKIDPLMSTFCAVSLMALNPAAVESAYSERGILMF
jgi:phage terminase large subunit-like protein